MVFSYYISEFESGIGGVGVAVVWFRRYEMFDTEVCVWVHLNNGFFEGRGSIFYILYPMLVLEQSF